MVSAQGSTSRQSRKPRSGVLAVFTTLREGWLSQLQDEGFRVAVFQSSTIKASESLPSDTAHLEEELSLYGQ
jgi:hypothetical protein